MSNSSQRDDTVDLLGPRDIADRIDQALERKPFRHGEYIIDAFERPVSMTEFLDGQKQDAAADGFAGAD